MKRRRTSTAARTWWYAFYRLMRIAQREHQKAVTDCLIYGLGAEIVCAETGSVTHVPWHQLVAIAEAVQQRKEQPHV